MNDLILLIQEYSWLYNFPIYFICGFYILFVLGWFFSTDYYDKMYAALDTGDDDVGLVHLMCAFAIAMSVLGYIFSGATGGFTLIVSSTLWVVVIGPVVVHYMLTLRLYLRKKRGKPL